MAYRKTDFVEQKRIASRARIIGAATALVRRKGWRGCTLKSVADSAGVSSGSIYTHFNKVTDLYREVYHLIAEEELAVIRSISERDDHPAQRFGALIDVFVGRALKGKVQAYAMIAEPAPPEVETSRQMYRQRFADALETILRDGAASGDFAVEDPASAATCALGALNEAMIAPLRPEAVARPDLRIHVRAFLMSAVGSETRPTLQDTERAATKKRKAAHNDRI